VNSNSKKSLHDERESFDKSVNESRREKRIKLYVDHNIVDLTLLGLADYLFDFVSSREGISVAGNLYKAVVYGNITGDIYSAIMDKKIDKMKRVLEKCQRT